MQVTLTAMASPKWHMATGGAALGPVSGSWHREQVGSKWNFNAEHLPAGVYKVQVTAPENGGGYTSGNRIRVRHLDGAAPV